MSGHTCKNCGHESACARIHLRVWVQMNPWPAAFVAVLGGVPLALFCVAVVIVYPAISIPLLATTSAALWLSRKHTRHNALAAHADAQHPALAALVAQPLPPMPTEPVPMHEAPTIPRGALRH